MRVLMSIKPKYVKSILDGTKKFEFRKKIFKRTDIDEIIIYSSSPEKKIVGSFEIDKVLEDSPEELWAYCRNNAGISKENFFKYFKGKDHGFAIKIKNLNILPKKLDPYEMNQDFHPPQSFCYVNPGDLGNIEFILNLNKEYELVSLSDEIKKKSIDYQNNLRDFMSWFGHDYREREIQTAIVEQLEKYVKIFPRSICFANLINFAEDRSLFIPSVISAFVRGLSVLKQSLFMVNTPEYPERYYLKMRQILLLEVSRIEDEFRKEFGKEFHEYMIQKYKPKIEIEKESKKQEDIFYWQQTLLDIFEIVNENEPCYQTIQLLLNYLKVDGWIEDFNKQRNFKGEK